LFEKGPPAYYYLGSREVTVPLDGPVGVIEQAAGELLEDILSKERDPTVELSVDRIAVYEV